MDFNPDKLQTLLSLDLEAYDANVPFDEMSVAQVRCQSLKRSLLKKWVPADQNGLEEVAIAKFLSCNAACANGFSLSTDASIRAIQLIARSHVEHALTSSGSNDITLAKSLESGKMGPGSSRGVRKTSFYRKLFAAPMTTTSHSLYKIYTTGIQCSTWSNAEAFRLRNYGTNIVNGSNLSTVPKNAETNRTICTEPSLNMFFQLGAGRLIEESLLRYFNIFFHKRNVNEVAYDQPSINRRMAREGSIYGNYATIDLSSASDTISREFVEFMLPRNAYANLDLFRSSHTVYKGVTHELHLFSSMGNGFTFPLQTMLFSALVRATYEFLGIKVNQSIRYRNYSVFGDDIICLSTTYGLVTQVLESCGFSVNHEKSFNSGPFRESCGSDFFRGHNVRGVYLKEIENAADVYSAFNRILRWSCYSGVSCPRALSYIKGLADFRPVPLYEDDASGFKVPHDLAGSRKRCRFTGAVFYRPLVPRVRRVKLNASDLDFNYQGALSASIGGYIRNGKYDERTKSSRLTYQVIKRLTPCWDHVTDAGLTSRDFYIAWSTL